MDRVEFLHSIGSTQFNCSDIVSQFFDQYMMIYDIGDDLKQTAILDGNDKYVIFELEFDNKESSKRIADLVSKTPTVTIYNNLYQVSFELKDRKLVLKFE